MKMYLLGLLCLVAFTTSLPVQPDPPALTDQEDITTNDAQKDDHELEEYEYEDEAEPPRTIVIVTLPEPPLLGALDYSILAELAKLEQESEMELYDYKTDDDEETLRAWNIPKPPFLSNIITSISNIMPSLSNINWPFQLPSIFNQGREAYPEIILIEEDY